MFNIKTKKRERVLILININYYFLSKLINYSI